MIKPRENREMDHLTTPETQTYEDEHNHHMNTTSFRGISVFRIHHRVLLYSTQISFSIHYIYPFIQAKESEISPMSPMEGRTINVRSQRKISRHHRPLIIFFRTQEMRNFAYGRAYAGSHSVSRPLRTRFSPWSILRRTSQRERKKSFLLAPLKGSLLTHERAYAFSA